ncbi:MAG: tRNA lysidine(34) synthetase TilS [Ardenticatenaceae bacterium]|nr:tRNA lysidine(34) synthetase TilS [Ardenticatenaceae bacterium]
MSRRKDISSFKKSILHHNLAAFWHTHQSVFKSLSPLIVSVSGGVDSLCLIHWLTHCLPESTVVQIRAITFDHGLRPESAAEAAAIHAQLLSWGVKSETISVPVRETVEATNEKEGSLSIETAGRLLRYQTLAQKALKYGAGVVLVAHQADDQAESILMHILRGSGLHGLVGMRPFSPWPVPQADGTIPNLQLVRPLLTTWRADIEAYAKLAGLDPIEDQSNFDLSFTRNRIRHAILPQLEGENPQIKRNLVQLGEITAADLEVLEQEHHLAWQEVIRFSTSDWVRGDVTRWRRLPLSCQRAVVRRAISRINPLATTISYEQVQQVVTLFTHGRSGQQTAGNTFFTAFLFYDDFLIGRGDPVEAFHVPQYHGKPQTLILSEGESSNSWTLDNKWLITTAPGSASPSQKTERWLQQGSKRLPCETELTLRTRQPGDYLQYKDSADEIHRKKLKSFFINYKIPQPLRQRWPLIASGSRIFWVVGVPHQTLLEQEVSTRRLYLRPK